MRGVRTDNFVKQALSLNTGVKMPSCNINVITTTTALSMDDSDSLRLHKITNHDGVSRLVQNYIPIVEFA